ncbi:hypothetical protein B0T14DRAFT_326530 [Immersiella caudata]|uniref:Uncharacterized protein n=1 Tax=Immersiella caudata TaxID=314043 RepID=A0AA39U432_9PEZI|nr:hypothetical protein B0T14DRAFT_326530 [Immersiella caudata]
MQPVTTSAWRQLLRSRRPPGLTLREHANCSRPIPEGVTGGRRGSHKTGREASCEPLGGIPVMYEQGRSCSSPCGESTLSCQSPRDAWWETAHRPRQHACHKRHRPRLQRPAPPLRRCFRGPGPHRTPARRELVKTWPRTNPNLLISPIHPLCIFNYKNRRVNPPTIPPLARSVMKQAHGQRLLTQNQVQQFAITMHSTHISPGIVLSSLVDLPQPPSPSLLTGHALISHLPPEASSETWPEAID